MMKGGMRGEGGCAWQRGVHGKGRTCMAKGEVCGEGGCAWQRGGGMHGKGGLCVVCIPLQHTDGQ